jgi:hypothetical protein
MTQLPRSSLAIPMHDSRKLLRKMGLIGAKSVATGFRDPGQMLWKMGREITLVGVLPIPNDQDFRPWIVEALNAATTGWHLCDWTARAMQERALRPLRDQWAINWIREIEKRSRKGAQDRLLSGVQVVATTECPELEICQILATRTKHRDSNRYAGTDIRLTVDYRREGDSRWKPGQMMDQQPIIEDGEYFYVAFDLLCAVHSWWKSYLMKLNFIGEDYFDALTSDSFQSNS